MTAKESCEIMMKANIRPTSIRILVYEAISKLHNTFCLSDLEKILDTIDKSSLFRALTLFHEHQLIHRVDDGSGCIKYCLCDNYGACQSEEVHGHFYCEECRKTYCLAQAVIPNLLLPTGFVAQKINYVIKGICANCIKKLK